MSGVTITGSWVGLREAIESFDVIRGEVENVQRAALLDLAEKARDHLRDSPRSDDGWPRDPDDPQDHPRSADLWSAAELHNGAILHNPADYASYVHIQPAYGGPPALAFRETEGPLAVLADYTALYEAEMSAFISRLLEK